MTHETKLRGTLPYGYECYTGHILTRYQVDSLNRINREIDGWTKEGRAVPEFLLDYSHRTFAMFSSLEFNQSIKDLRKD